MAIVTDSVSCLTKELIEQYDIEVIPMNFYVGGKTYREWLDVTPSQAYEFFLQDPESFKTSAATPETCLEAYHQARRRATDILCVTVSGSLSTMYNCALKAQEMAEEELPGTRIEVLDSRTATPAEGFVTLAAARAAALGKEMDEVISAALTVRDRVSVIISLDTIRHVYRSGRIPKIASQIGSALNIRPLLSVSGSVKLNGMVRSRRQGIERIIQIMKEKTRELPVHAAVTHAYALEEAERLKERVAAEFKCLELWLSEFSPIMGYACGTGTVGVAFYTEED